MNLLNLPHWIVLEVKESRHDYAVEARYAAETAACPHCQATTLYGHGLVRQTVMDVPSHGKRVGVNLLRTRWRCRACNRTFAQPIPDIDDRSHMTRRLVGYIEQQAIRRTFTSIADEVGVHERTVRRLFAAYVAHMDQTVTFPTPEWMGMDEVHLLRKPRFIVTNLKERTVVAVQAERSKKAVMAYLKALPDKDRVQVVSMDMWTPYRDAVKAHLPHAAIVIDKFHVVRMASQCLDAVRKQVRSGLTATQRRKLMHDRFILLRRTADLKPEQVVTRDAWLKSFPELAEAYRLKEEFYHLYALLSKEAAWEAFQAWEKSASREMKTAFKPLLTAVYNWRTEIFAYFDHRATNALTEALNGIAKNLNRNGRGYSFEAIRAKMLYAPQVQKRPKYGNDFDTEGRAHGCPPPPWEDYNAHRDALTAWPTLGADVDELLKLAGGHKPDSARRAKTDDA